MAKKARSAYWSADDADAKISMARSVLNGVQTFVDYRLYEADFGAAQCIIRECAGDIQVMLNVVQNLLGQAEEALKEITEDTQDNGGERNSA